MLDLFKKDHLDQEDIEKIVDLRLDESIDLEFKKAEEISVSNDAILNKMSVIISSFANTVGGVLIYGIDTKRRRAREFNFVNDAEINADKLRHYLGQRIRKEIKNLDIFHIQFDNNPEKSIFVFRIPESRMSPHMAYDSRFYKRSNFKEVLMEEYEVRMAYHKTTITDIEFFGIVNTGGIPTMHNGRFTEMNFYPKFMIRNISSAIEHTYKFELYIPSALHDSDFSLLQNNFSKHDGIYSVFSLSNRSPLFQEELATVIEAKLSVNQENYGVYQSENIMIKLYYSNGIKQHDYKISDTFRYKQQELKLKDFTLLSDNTRKIEFPE